MPSNQSKELKLVLIVDRIYIYAYTWHAYVLLYVVQKKINCIYLLRLIGKFKRFTLNY